ncbi:DUF3105 domain-containing protein [Nocardioides mangrovi]|uniref:DUF3105 domain-containing protein n=1 Tax=Nocardioides mangrovi TaxID=2874580 RepID=A0ABS7UCX4_9ACTN|nr:DUF3105 domain-containing protein [Nocardioides mangrovi]MBZ5738680.1 DUF3105 domain-containing protein [Nocardioides mangrovi]
MTDHSPIPPPPPYPPPAQEEPGPHLVASYPTPPTPSRRGPVIALAVVGAAIVVALAVGVALLTGSEPVPRDLSAVTSYSDLAVTHTDGDVDYPQSPPVGGEHAPAWLECGVYDDPVRDENAVHDLEHGAVWISYRPGLADDDVATLAGELPQNGIMAPYPGLDAPVVVTVWGEQLALTGADDPRLELFIQRYGGGETAPEPFASCAGGITNPGGQQGTDV